ncbi:MAG: hypothetical protein ACFFC6_00550 [Promethearchaeota archaeon]
MSPCNNLKVLVVNNEQMRKGERMNCVYLLRAANIGFCLKLKEVNTKCPARCPFFVEGAPGSYQDALERELDIECLYCTRQNLPQFSTEEAPTFYCDLYKSSQPLCARCFYARYKSED